jgi:outer membrane lipoprotein SlyB
VGNLIIGSNDQALHKEKPSMNIKPKILYPSLIIAAFSVTLLSLTGVAALTGYLPGANARQDEALQSENLRKGTAPTAKVAATCNTCGTVESVRLVERKGSGTGLGAVAGGVAGALLGHQVGGGSGRTVMTIAGAGGGAYAGNEIEKNMNKSSAYQIRVRMADGSLRTLHQRDVPSVNSGDRVRLSNGAITEVL